MDESLDPRYLSLQRELGWYVSAGISLALLIGAFVLLGIRRWYWVLPLWLIGSLLVAWVCQRWPAIDYRHRAYRLDEETIQIRSGVLWRAVSNVPRSRVQHTDVSQGPLERKHGLGRLVIYTAGTSHSRLELPGLDHTRALSIRDHLLPRQQGDVV